jgi:DNA polymerase-3 subunit epsilon
VTVAWDDRAVSVVFEVPHLLVAFDVESTGLDTSSDEAISYGFAEFIDGEFVGSDEYFVLPDVPIHPGAEKVHGVSLEHLEELHRTGVALSARSGASRALRRLLEYAGRGATFVGSNPMFDFTMLDSTLRRQGAGGLAEGGFDLASVPLIDVVTHDRAIDPDRVSRPRRGLAFLCAHYGVAPGEHRAAEDARAAGEVLLAQVARVRQRLERPTACTSEEVSDSEAWAFRRWARSLFRSRS